MFSTLLTKQLYFIEGFNIGISPLIETFPQTVFKYGLTSFLVRLEDKLNRARTLSQKDGLVADEKIKDTLLDMANYAVLAVIELDAEEQNGN